MFNILIIGFGKTGSHLYYALKASRLKLNIKVHKNSRLKLNIKNVSEADVIFICTQDDKIPAAVKLISDTRLDLKGKIITHTSGVHSSGELKLLKKFKADTASFHPVQTFENKAAGRSNRFKNIYVAIEGTGKSEKVLSKLAKAVNAYPFTIDKKFKTLHHICCVISSNFLVTNLSHIERIYRRKNGFKKHNFFNIYMPLIFQTLSNISHKGTVNSLTGPIARNDVNTVRKHIKELEKIKDKQIIDYYKLISNLTINIASRTRVVSKKQFKQLTKTKN